MTRTTIHSDYIPDNAITGTKIAENSITAREIATNAITTLYVADDSVTADKLANSINADIATGVAALPKAGGTMTGNLAITKEDPTITLTDSSASRTLATFVDNNNSVIRSSGQMLLQIGSESGITIDANKKVGIGTGSPASVLEVNNLSAGDTVATFEGSYGSGGDVQLVRYERGGGAVYGAISYKDATTDMEFGNISSHALSFTTGNTRRMTIDASGNVGIGTSSPSSKLTLSDSGTNSIVQTRFINDAQNFALGVHGGLSDSFVLYDETNSATRVVVKTDGKVGIGKTPSTWFLDVDSSSTNVASFDGSNNTGVVINSSSSIADIIGFSNSASSYNALNIRGASGTGLVVDTSNNVGIGTTSPTEKLTVAGAITTTGALSDDRTSTGAIDFSSGVTRFVSYGASGTGGIFAFRTASGGASSAERMRILGTGEVHITSAGDAITPTIKHGGATGDVAKLRLINRSGQGADKGGVLELGAVTNDGVTRSDVFASLHGGKDNATSGNKAGYLDFATSAGSSLDRRMRLDSNGMLLIGDTAMRGTNQRGQLQVTQISNSNAAGISCISGNDEIAGTFCLYSSGTASAMVSVDPDSQRASSAFYVWIDGSERMSLNSSGNLYVTGSYSNSDRELKENITTLSSQLEKVKQLNPVSFDWKEKAEDGSTQSSIGFVAQEVEELYPNLVTKPEEDTDAEQGSKTKYKTLNYPVMVSILTKAIQEQQATIESLKTRLDNAGL